jgi:hypothetical protein
MEKVGVFYANLECITAIWYILWLFGCLVTIWYIFPRFGILRKEKNLAAVLFRSQRNFVFLQKNI